MTAAFVLIADGPFFSFPALASIETGHLWGGSEQLTLVGFCSSRRPRGWPISDIPAFSNTLGNLPFVDAAYPAAIFRNWATCGADRLIPTYG